MQAITTTQTKLPAGRYYVGDLCYVMKPEWDEALQASDYGEGVFALADGRRFAIFGAAYGDGQYPCSNGASIGVDSGTVGCIRIADISDPKVQDEAELNRLGTVVVFCDEFGCGSDNGVLFFGGVAVDTAGEDDDGDDGDYYEEDQDEDDDY